MLMILKRFDSKSAKALLIPLQIKFLLFEFFIWFEQSILKYIFEMATIKEVLYFYFHHPIKFCLVLIELVAIQ